MLRMAEDLELDGPIGLVVHPKRDIDGALSTIREWAAGRRVDVGQVPVDGQHRQVAERIEPEECALVVAVGGDGTALAALHAAAKVERPVLAIACGSVGALTAVNSDRLDWALDQVAAEQWTQHRLPALEVRGEQSSVALNDVAAVRDGDGQIVSAISIDGELYARIAGDGVIVSTPSGSSAYTMAAGGPLLAATSETFVITPLAPHGGSAPPLVAGSHHTVTLELQPGYGGLRIEVDGRRTDEKGTTLTITRRPDYATLVMLSDGEPMIAGLRSRGLIVDSPRAVIREKRG
jgi:NAD+ kinase